MDDSLEKLADKLSKYVDDCNLEFNRDAILKVDNAKEWLLAQSLICFLNSGSEQTKAIALCLSHKFVTSARTCLRSLVEMNLDVRLILDYNDPYENAARFLIHSALELKNTLTKNNGSDIIDPIDERLNEYKILFPNAFSEINGNFNSHQRIKHWSGLSYRNRLSNIKHAKFQGLDTVYGILSWDTHSRMAVHNSKFELIDRKLNVKPLDEDNIDSYYRIADSAGMIFHSLFNSVFYSPIVIERSTGKQFVRPPSTKTNFTNSGE